MCLRIPSLYPCTPRQDVSVLVSNIWFPSRWIEMLSWQLYPSYLLEVWCVRIWKRHLLQLVDIWRRRYICWGPGHLPDHIPTHHWYWSQCRGSQENVFALLYVMCMHLFFKSHAIISAGDVFRFCLLVLCPTAFCSFCWVEKAEDFEGS